MALKPNTPRHICFVHVPIFFVSLGGFVLYFLLLWLKQICSIKKNHLIPHSIGKLQFFKQQDCNALRRIFGARSSAGRTFWWRSWRPIRFRNRVLAEATDRIIYCDPNNWWHEWRSIFFLLYCPPPRTDTTQFVFCYCHSHTSPLPTITSWLNLQL